MSIWRLVARSTAYFWRTNLAVVLGVATAVAVLAGALLVGHSVRASLADLVERRLGRTDAVLASSTFFREQLAADLGTRPELASRFPDRAPLIVTDGVVTEQNSGRRANRVKVYGVDERFWDFHGVAPISLGDRDVAINGTLAREIGAEVGQAVLVRVQRPSDVPLESLHARKDDVGRTMRLIARQILDTAGVAEFSLDAQQGDVYAVFVPLAQLQAELEVARRVNTLLLAQDSGTATPAPDDADPNTTTLMRGTLAPEDVGLTVQPSDDGREVIIGATSGLLDDAQATVVREALTRVQTAAPIEAREVFTYLANDLKVGDREIPYSLITGTDLGHLLPRSHPALATPNGIVLNQWAADQLAAHVGAALTAEYYVWQDPGQLVTRQAEFVVTGIVPIAAGTRDLAPTYPGISNATNLRDWDPPFPLDLRRVRPVDEAYWEQYRTTPKAFVSMETARRLWSSRYGAMTSIRLAGAGPSEPPPTTEQISAALTATIPPAAFGLDIRDVREANLAASAGATDFGEYFIYFSFFLVVSALVLVVLFFRLGIEQRVREIGLLRAVGLGPEAVRRLFLTEGIILALAGSILGIFGAVGYAWLLITALTTWWVDAVGTTALTLHVSPLMLAAGGAGGVIAAAVCIWWTLRGLRQVSERALLTGDLTAAAIQAPATRRTPVLAALAGVLGVASAGLAGLEVIPAVAGFFGAGALLLVAALTAAGIWLRRPIRRMILGRGWRPLAHLAARQAAHRPGRTVLTMTVLASATFILVTVDAFRRDVNAAVDDPASGTGGYEVLVRTLLPMVHDPTSAEGREALNLFSLAPETQIEPLRVRPGDDASCLNLYRPTNPRIAAPRNEFIDEGRFSFQASAAETDAERANPWLLLRRTEPDGAIPVIGDANSMAYVLHRAVGDVMVIDNGGVPVTMRFVAALSDSIFQSEVLMSADNFRRLFPDQPGYQMLLVDTPGDPAAVMQDLEQGLGDIEADAVETGRYLASFHRVENTYLSTFQTLGGLGLLLGTVGLATVLLRNVLERRREIGLLAAVGYRRSHFLAMAAVENLLIVCGGLAIGAACAAVAIAPTIAERGGRLPLSAGAWLLLGAVFVVAMISSVVAMAAATRSPLLDALRSE